MTVDDALRAAAGLFREKTGSVLPYYALVAATGDVARLPVLIGVIAVYTYLASTGRLDLLIDDLAGLNPELLDPESPAGPGGLPPEIGERLAEILSSPAVVGPLVGSILVGVVCYVLARGVTRAAALGAVEASLADDARDPLAAGVDGVGRWRTFAGLVVVRWGLFVVAGIPVLVALFAGAGTLGTMPESGTTLDQGAVFAVLAAFAGVLVTVAALVVVLALLAFVGPAVVVDDVGIRGAVRRSAGVPVAHPVGFVVYAVVVVACYGVLGVGTVVLGIAGVSRLVALLSAFLLAPLLDSLAVALYLGWADERTLDRTDPTDTGAVERSSHDTPADESAFVFGVDPGSENPWNDPESVRGTVETEHGSDAAGSDRETTDDGSTPTDGKTTADRTPTDEGIVSGVRGAFRGGVAELAGFVRRDWGYVVLAAAVLVVGAAGGWRATAGYGVQIPTPDDPGAVFGAVPVGPFVNIAVNNWIVATNAGFSGLFAGLPTVGTLLFNGLLVGAVAGVVEPLLFVAFVAPHGVIELPAIAVAGGVGLRLGHVAWGAWCGTRPRSALVGAVGRTWRIAVGLSVVFLVAGFVEAFVTPQVAAWVLGG
ncbi:stage II sporulation protein M [Salinigranum sp. GCM10025319]|uniref:stage II sporulation protein M n=1 Tax=Salinigranum sp. GCM10025319 TaxID=3252687 RepID=UPI0036234FF5